jgi:hypothetical protein
MVDVCRRGTPTYCRKDQDGRTHIVVGGKHQIGNVGSRSAVVSVPHDRGLGIRKLHIPNARSGIKKSNHYAMSMGATLGKFSNAAAAEVL